jgi:hypothetical protein
MIEEAGLSGARELLGKFGHINVPGRFGEQQSATRFHCVGGLAEEPGRPGHLVHHGEGEDEINGALEVVDAHRRWWNQVSIDAIK